MLANDSTAFTVNALLVAVNLVGAVRFVAIIEAPIGPLSLAAVLHTMLEGAVDEYCCCNILCTFLEMTRQNIVRDETGTPAGWYPLIAGYDTLPTLPNNLDIPHCHKSYSTILQSISALP